MALRAKINFLLNTLLARNIRSSLYSGEREQYLEEIICLCSGPSRTRAVNLMNGWQYVGGQSLKSLQGPGKRKGTGGNDRPDNWNWTVMIYLGYFEIPAE